MLDAVAKSAEAQRLRYKPARIRVLFVGESAPARGVFFYDANSPVYWGLREALSEKLGNPADFLAAFSQAGYYLDDLVLVPVNWEKNQAKRRRLHAENVPGLAARIEQYQPEMIVSILKAIGPAVEQARQLSGLEIPHHIVSFPWNGRQNDFRREMALVAPLLP